jgi:hypothetical protein
MGTSRRVAALPEEQHSRVDRARRPLRTNSEHAWCLAGADLGDDVLEIGPGFGALTSPKSTSGFQMPGVFDPYVTGAQVTASSSSQSGSSPSKTK